jgi:hypothetical protein
MHSVHISNGRRFVRLEKQEDRSAMKKRLATCACFVIPFVFMAFVPLPAYAERILYSISRDDDLLRVINPSSGSTISSVPITLAGQVVSFGNGLATHPVTGQLFALLTLDGQTGRQLVIINPNTGVATSIGDTGDQFAGLAFNSSGTLYAVVGDKRNSAGGGLPPETLFTLNTSNAVPTQVLVLGRGNDGEAIGFNPNDGLIYHASGNDTGGDSCEPFNPSVCVEIFESINPNTLAVTNITLSGAYTPLTELFGSISPNPSIGQRFAACRHRSKSLPDHHDWGCDFCWEHGSRCQRTCLRRGSRHISGSGDVA